MSGHVDGLGKVTHFAPVGESWRLDVLAPAALGKYFAYKGSVVVNGVSLTVNSVADSDAGCTISINLIPHTIAVTTLKHLKVVTGLFELKHAFTDRLSALIAHNGQFDETIRKQTYSSLASVGGVAGHSHPDIGPDDPGYFGRMVIAQEVSAVTGACLMTRREVFESAGRFDAEHLAVAFNDIDLCLRVRRAGYSVIWTPHAALTHHESKSRGKEDTLEKRDRFRSEVEYMRATWGDLLDHDPAYNPNLTLTINDFTLALPPRDWPPLR